MGVARGLRIGFPEDWWWMSRPLGGPVALPHRRTEVGGRKTEIFAMGKGKRRISQWSAKKCVRSDAKLESESRVGCLYSSEETIDLWKKHIMAFRNLK